MFDPPTNGPDEQAPRKPVDLVVSVVAVLVDDAPIADEFVREVESVLQNRYPFYELVLVDNHSSDGTATIAVDLLRTRPCLRYLRLSRATSREIAQAAGLEHAIGDFVVLMDPNIDPCGAIPTMVDAALVGYDVVVGIRTGARPTGRGRRLLFQLASRMVGAEIDPDLSFFRLFSRRVVTSLTKIKHRRRFLRYLNAIVGFRQTTLPIETPGRWSSRARPRNFWTSARTALDLVFSHSATPLRWASLMGLTAGLLNLCYLLYVLVVVLVKQKLAEGWLTTSVMIGSMFFMLFLILAVLSEYVARILDEVQERPLYFLELEAESTTMTRRPEQRLNLIGNSSTEGSP